MIRIVFIGNDKKCLSILKMSIPGINISQISNCQEVIIALKKINTDIIIIDLDLKDDKCFKLINEIQNMENSPSILVTGISCSTEKIIKAIKMGVIEYIPKPYNPASIQKLENIIYKINTLSLIKDRNIINHKSTFLSDVIGCSKQIEEVKEQMGLYSKSEASILLLGESGVGKTFLAEIIHKISKRSNSIFKSVHTAGIPPTLIESELYGTREGAFTDAKSRSGLFELANKGTLFLDEIGELPLSVQVKLLTILEERTITPLGGYRQIPIDVRIISATNINISKAVKNHLFRQDLYYRINTLTINIPPLRDRKEDIPLLVHHYLRGNGIEYSITNIGLEKLIDHPWPGNIRELRNTLERSKALVGEKYKISDKYIKFYER